MPTRPRILVVEDEPHILEFLAENLERDDFEVLAAPTAAHARAKLTHAPELAVLDVGLPDGNGYDLCREIRDADPLRVRFDPTLPIVMLTACADDVDRVRGFQRGADDFVAKPFHYPELLARIEAIMRRATVARSREVVAAAGVVIDLATRQVQVDGVPVTLSAKEFLLLAALAADPRRVYPKQELLEQVWGFRSSGATRTLDSHASRLRRKLRAINDERAWVDNVWGVGYRLVALEDVA